MSLADEHAFLDAILARHHDDGPQLVYADYLAESGDPDDFARAELIRVQVARAHLPAHHPRQPELKEREAELLQRHRTAWGAEFASLGVEVEFRRGLPDSVAIDAAAFLARGGELFRRTRVGPPPGRSFVRRVRLLDPARVLPRLVECPFLADVEELVLCGGGLGNSGVAQFVTSPHLGAVRLLDLGFNGLDDTGVRILARSSGLPRLRVLALNDNRQITWDGVRALAESPFFAGVEELDLSGNVVNDAGVLAVTGSANLSRLHALRLQQNLIGDAGVVALVGSSLFRRLIARDPRLDLRENAIGPVGAASLAACPGLDRVADLDLSGNYLGDHGVAVLTRSGRLGNLRSLRLARNQISDVGARLLAAAVVTTLKLRDLDLSGNRLTRRGVEALGAAGARGLTIDVTANGTEPSVPVLASGVTGRPHLDQPEADIAALKRRVTHPARRV